MLRLRTTTSLSVLALIIGVAGTQWLSDQTGNRAESLAAHGVHHAVVHRAVAQHVVRREHPASVRRVTYVSARGPSVPLHAPAATVVPRSDAVAWIPVSMPVSSIPFAQMRNHDAGSLVLHLVVDGQGQVTQATLAQSSGDAVLDANALAIARRWRFAVSADHPQGFSGDLPLSFGSGAAQFAQMP
ncbi:energy transducer TonB [Dyella caseinilytica]|uniref:TonB family protein n=1 Tax=Dyella caseinilytica TaxID=1849581 RepID=A0ABX7GV44_9GAMM|nr:TonB family protein [Dyella caseinilytica]QRN53923.1 TonB family protein [Dyella caseinilytica]GFZ90131.1 hypothetical protein GCM10011408_06590 [Dyella caseinilytica]